LIDVQRLNDGAKVFDGEHVLPDDSPFVTVSVTVSEEHDCTGKLIYEKLSK
jgi:hypothetical protein